MFKRIRFYLISGVILIVGLILLFNKVFIVGLIIVGIAALIYVLWEFFLKERAKQMEFLNQSLNDKSEENKRLKDELKDYSKRKLNISEVNTIMELGLFEVKTNFKRTVNKELTLKDKNVQFFGVIDVDFVAKYGVDFRKLRFKIDEENKEIFITDANPEFLSFTKRTCTWEIEKILEFSTPVIGTAYWKTNPKLDNIADKIKEEVRIQVELDSENGPSELKWIIEPLRKHVERALEIIIGAQGYKIRLTELDGENYKSFQEYKDEKKIEQISSSASE